MQTYKTELTLSPSRAQTTEMFKNIHEYCPDIFTHEQTSSKVEEQIDKEQKELSEGENDLRYPTPLHKSQQSFYPKQVGSNKVDSEENKVKLSKDNFVQQAKAERVTHAQKSETKVMPETTTYEALLSPNTKRLLAASYSGWGISTECGFDRLLEQGFDGKLIVFPALQSKEYSDGQPQEKEIRKAHIENKIAEAMLRDANNNVIPEKVIVKEKAQRDEKQNRKCPAIEEAKFHNAKSSKENEEPHSPLTSQNVIKLSKDIVEESVNVSKYENPSLEPSQLQLEEVKADDEISTKGNEERLNPLTPLSVFKSSLQIVGGSGVISKSEIPTMESTHLQLEEVKTNAKLSNEKTQEHFISLVPQYVPNSSQQSLEGSGVITKTEEPTIEYTHPQLEEAKTDAKLDTETNQECCNPPSPQNVAKSSQESVGGSGLISQSEEPNMKCAYLPLNETTPDIKLSTGNNEEQSNLLTSQNVAKPFHQVLGGSEVTLKFEDPTQDSFQLTETNKAKKKPFKAELTFFTPKRVATKVEARNVLQKKLNNAMKNTFKSEKKIQPKKTTKTEAVPRNVQKSEQRRSLKYELMLEDIMNEELYQSTSVSGGSAYKDNINSKTEEGVYAKDGNYEKLGVENNIIDTNLEENKKETVSALSYITETNLYLKRSQLKRLSRPEHESRKWWKDDESSQRVYKSEKHFLPRHRHQMTAEPKRDLTKHHEKTQEHKIHHEKRKGPSKVYKISCTTIQKSTTSEKKGKCLAKKDNLFSYKLNWCYRLPIQRKSQRQDDSSQEETARDKEKVRPQWTTTISFEQNRKYTNT